MAPATGVRPIIGSNWKMHLTPGEADRYLATFRELVADVGDRDLFVLPSYPALQTARDRLLGSNVLWGAQDVHPEDSGAHTGDVSAPMLADLGCRFVMVGHTERRRDHGEGYDLVRAKVATIVRWGMVPIICLGEWQPSGPDGALDVVLADLERATLGLPSDDPPEIVVAYEPSWAIGQGSVAAAPADIVDVHRGIHGWLERHGFTADRGRVIYGGSVDREVAEQLLEQPAVDGLFVGRAALDPMRFADIAHTPLSARGSMPPRARS